MTPIAVQVGDIPAETFEMFWEMRYIFERLPNFQFDPPISCHVICRAFAENYPVECVDGHFARGSDHSWLVMNHYTLMEHGRDAFVIADMYPCRGATPFLIYKDFSLSWIHHYIEDPSVTAHFCETSEFQEQVTEVATVVAQLRQEFEEAKRSI